MAGSTVEGALSRGGTPGRDRQELAQWDLGVPLAWRPRGQEEGRWLVRSSC